MRVRALPTSKRVFRIGDPAGRHPIFSGEGASSVEGRWHQKGQEVIYTSVHYSTAMLEKLAHYNGVVPPNQHFIEIEVPAGSSYEVVTKDSLRGWDEPEGTTARAHGSAWLHERRTLLLFVPSFVAREEENVLINPNHGQFARLQPSLERPIWWDERLLRR